MFTKDGTAQGVAKQRLIESLAPADKRVVYDPFAKYFVAGAGLMKLWGHRFSVWITQKFAPGFHHHLIARTRFIDDLVEDCSAKGITQYVILGAGYDARAHRLNLAVDMYVFEVDQVEVQSRKRAKLPAQATSRANLTYVEIDFETQTLTQQLLDAGFDSSKPTLFTLEGVSQYITKDALADTIAEIAQLSKQSQAIFCMTYVNELLKSDPLQCFGKGYPKAERRANAVMMLAAKVSEPWISLYSDQELASMLSEQGFEVTDNKTLADLNEPYFGAVGRALPENQIFKLEHFLVASSSADSN